MSRKPILCIDFDGVIHRYSRGWNEGRIYDPVTPGFFAWAAEAQLHFSLIIHSSRASTEFGLAQIRTWLHLQLRDWDGPIIHFDIRSTKPPAWVSIDDRCIRFEGNWNDPGLKPEVLLNFIPWMNKIKPAASATDPETGMELDTTAMFDYQTAKP